MTDKMEAYEQIKDYLENDKNIRRVTINRYAMPYFLIEPDQRKNYMCYDEPLEKYLDNEGLVHILGKTFEIIYHKEENFKSLVIAIREVEKKVG